MTTSVRARAIDPVARELPEPREKKSPLPVLFLVMLGGFGAFGLSYFTYHSGLDFASEGDQRSPAREVAHDLDGATLFQTHCSTCHQADGRGVPGAFPPLAGSEWVAADGETPVRVVLRGIEGDIEVMGKRFNGVMPEFRSKLGDDEIARIVTHVRSSWGNQAAPVDGELVRSVREQLRDKVGAWRGGEELGAARGR